MRTVLSSCNSRNVESIEINNILIIQIERNQTHSVEYINVSIDSIIHKFQGGFVDIKNKNKTSENTTYNAYSITKTFIALAILQLIEKEEIDNEQTAIKYFHNFPYRAEITIRQLLNHKSGIQDSIFLRLKTKNTFC